MNLRNTIHKTLNSIYVRSGDSGLGSTWMNRTVGSPFCAPIILTLHTFTHTHARLQVHKNSSLPENKLIQPRLSNIQIMQQVMWNSETQHKHNKFWMCNVRGTYLEESRRNLFLRQMTLDMVHCFLREWLEKTRKKNKTFSCS